MSQPLLVWFACVAATSSSVGMAALLLNRQRVEADQMSRRLDLVAESFAVAAPGRARRVRSKNKRSGVALRPTLERLFGYDRRRRPHQAVPFVRVLAFGVAFGLVAGFVSHRMLGLLGWGVGAPVSVFAVRLFYHRCDERYSDRLFKQFPDALGMIVRAVRVGVGVGNAVVLVADECQAPTSLEFRQLAEEIAIGRPLPDALRAMGARNRLAEYRFFATALSLQSQTGGGLAETLETLAETIRKRVAIKARGHALAAEARLSCYVLGGLPFVVGTLLFLSNRDYVEILFTTVAGEKMLGLAATMLMFGMLVMRTMTKRALQ